MKRFLKRSWAEIDLDALKSNYLAIKEKADGKEVAAVVKADAYGHGDMKVALFLQKLGVNNFCVSNIIECERLRKAGVTGNIIIFGYTDNEYFDCIVKYNATQTTGNVQYAKELSDYAISHNVKISVHIKVNTGMTRVGIETKEELNEIMALEGLSPAAAYTHFSCADNPDEEDVKYTENQYKKLRAVTDGSGLPIHCRNSGGIISYPQFDSYMVRAGIILYGNYPNYPVVPDIAIKPVMTLKSVISQLKVIDKNTAVSYGRTFISDKAMKIAVVPIGYADGYMRDFSSKGKMLVNGVLCPVIGRVCMDQTIIDVSDVSDVKVGDEVLVYSAEHKKTGIDYNASLIGTIGYELTCAVSMRVPRVYIENGEITDSETYNDVNL